jgi:hypothetical protein
MNSKKRSFAITLPNADKTPGLDTIINAANNSPSLKDTSAPTSLNDVSPSKKKFQYFEY